MFAPCLVSCTERFPLAVQIIFSEETVAASVTLILEVLRNRGVVVNSKTLDTGAERRPKLE